MVVVERLLLATVSDVEDRLSDTVDEADHREVLGLIEEASILVEGFIGTVPDPVPRPVAVVVSRMVARVMESPTDGHAVESTSYTAGAFSKSTKYTAGASGGAPWMNATDKKMLARFQRRRRRGGIYTIEMG